MKNSTPKTYYIYVLKNEVNDKVYVGQTSDPKDRFYAQQYRAKKIADAIKTIGWDKFHVNLVHETNSKDEADELEFETIVKFDSVNNGYNSTYNTHYVGNKKRSKKTCAKARATMRGMKWYFNPKTEETIRIKDGDPIPKGFIYGRGGKLKRVKGHDLWLNVTERTTETKVAEIA